MKRKIIATINDRTLKKLRKVSDLIIDINKKLLQNPNNFKKLFAKRNKLFIKYYELDEKLDILYEKQNELFN